MKEYRDALDQLKFTKESEAALVNALTDRQADPNRRQPRRWSRTAMVTAAIICAFILSVGAGVVVVPVLSNYYQNSAGYHKSGVLLGESVTQGGWTMTLTDCVADDYNLYIGLTLTAPEGVVLDWADGYLFDRWQTPTIPALGLCGSASYLQVDDGNPTDNSIQFVLQGRYMMEKQNLSGQEVNIIFGNLYHNAGWDGEVYSYEKLYDCKETWHFTTQIPDTHVIRLEPNLPVTTLGVQATITQLEISPIGVYVYIEGDALKGHHSWVAKNAPDGWYGCMEYQEITLYTTDGTAIPMTDGIVGSGCSGGTDLSEPGSLQLARRSETLLDIDALDHITICDVDIPLSPVQPAQ